MRPGTGYISRNSSRRRLLGNGVRTLKSQIILALGLMTSLFAGAILYALHIVDHQRADDEMLRMGGELQLLLQQVSIQAMSYKKNAPRDYDAYFRDTRLYYQDLLSKRDQLEAIIEAFAQKRILPAAMSHHASRSPLNLSDRSRRLAIELQSAWRDFTRVLDDKLGDPVEPRLEWGGRMDTGTTSHAAEGGRGLSRITRTRGRGTRHTRPQHRQAAANHRLGGRPAGPVVVLPAGPAPTADRSGWLQDSGNQRLLTSRAKQ